MKTNTGWSHSKKRAGAYFIMPDADGAVSSWTQELPDRESLVMREAVRRAYDYFCKTYRRLDEKQKKEVGEVVRGGEAGK